MTRRLVLINEENKSTIAITKVTSELSLVSIIKALNDTKKQLIGDGNTDNEVLEFIENVNLNDDIKIELDNLNMIEFYL